METQTTLLLIHFISLLTGAAIGFAFGATGNSATVPTLRATAMRVVLLLGMLVAVQYFAPFFSVAGAKWWILAGISLGYGFQRARRLRLKLATASRT